MYIPKHFREKDRKKLVHFMRNYNFGIMVNRAKKRYWATHLPFIITEKGNEIFLKAHMAKANPQWTKFTKEEVLVIFSEPHSYISPRLYDHKTSVPTWNYIAVHAYGVPEILPSEKQKIKLLEESFDNFEKSYKNQWNKLPVDYKKELLENITVFRIKVTRMEGKYKLSQNRTMEEREKIIDALNQSAEKTGVDVAKYMKLNKVIKI